MKTIKPKKIKDFQFDHTYSTDMTFKFRKKLEKIGFKLSPHATRHPGGSICKFIGIKGSRQQPRQYLEFIHKRKGHEPYPCPGLSLAANMPVEKYFNRIKNDKVLKPTFLHRDYDWKTPSTDRRPGWNFVFFKNTPDQIRFWLTEYEPTSVKYKKIQKISHANTALRISRIEIDVSRKDEKFFCKIFKVRTLGLLELNCGTQIQFTSAKKTREKAVVIEVKSLNKLSGYRGLTQSIYNGKPAYQISNPVRNSWDLVFVAK